jgi:hypothetical protein
MHAHTQTTQGGEMTESLNCAHKSKAIRETGPLNEAWGRGEAALAHHISSESEEQPGDKGSSRV